MSELHRGRRLRWWLLLAAGWVLTLASPACACQETGSRLEWDHCWSWLRLGVWLLAVLAAGAFTFFIVFPSMLQPEKRNAPWPRTAFGWSLAIWWLLSGGLFLLLFAVIYGDLRGSGSRFLPPGGFGAFINLHWQWLLVLALTLGGAWLVYWRVRHYERAAD